MRAPPRPLVIAHRGASAEAPENTIAAFERALALGADAIELDVHLSKDDQPWSSTTSPSSAPPTGPARCARSPSASSSDWTGAAGSGPTFRGQRLQTLQEVLERFRDRARLWIELKGGSSLYPGIEERVVGLLEVYGVLERTLVQSFDAGVLRTLRTLSREVRLGVLVAHRPIDPKTDLAPGLDAICPRRRSWGRRSGRRSARRAANAMSGRSTSRP